MIVFWHCDCGYQNNQDVDKIADMTGFRKVKGNLYRLLPTWVKRLAGIPVKGRTYCEHCLEPHDFVCLPGVECPIIN